MPNPFIHVELNSTDVEKSKAFYRKLFNWDLEDVAMKDYDYTMIQGWRGHRRRNDEAADPRRSILVARVRRGE